jgi:hypothetical protein
VQIVKRNLAKLGKRLRLPMPLLRQLRRSHANQNTRRFGLRLLRAHQRGKPFPNTKNSTMVAIWKTCYVVATLAEASKDHCWRLPSHFLTRGFARLGRRAVAPGHIDQRPRRTVRCADFFWSVARAIALRLQVISRSPFADADACFQAIFAGRSEVNATIHTAVARFVSRIQRC